MDERSPFRRSAQLQQDAQRQERLELIAWTLHLAYEWLRNHGREATAAEIAQLMGL